MAARKGYAVGKRHVRLGLLEPDSFHDLAPDPARIALPGDFLDHLAEQTVAEVLVFEAGVGLDHRGALERGHELAIAQEGPPVEELPGIAAVADQACAMGEQLRNGGARNRRVQPVDELAHRSSSFSLPCSRSFRMPAAV